MSKLAKITVTLRIDDITINVTNCDFWNKIQPSLKLIAFRCYEVKADQNTTSLHHSYDLFINKAKFDKIEDKCDAIKKERMNIAFLIDIYKKEEQFFNKLGNLLDI